MQAVLHAWMCDRTRIRHQASQSNYRVAWPVILQQLQTDSNRAKAPSRVPGLDRRIAAAVDNSPVQTERL